MHPFNISLAALSLMLIAIVSALLSGCNPPVLVPATDAGPVAVGDAGPVEPEAVCLEWGISQEDPSFVWCRTWAEVQP